MTTNNQAPAGLHMNDLRRHLMNTLADLRDRTNPMEVDRARAVAQVASVLIDSAKVEVDYMQKSGQELIPFLEVPPDASVKQLGNTSSDSQVPGHNNGIATITRHRMRG